jgi:cation transport ATPase
MSTDKTTDQRLRELRDKMRARSDSELLEILNDKPDNWTPEALSFAESEVEARGALRARWERQKQERQERETQEHERQKREHEDDVRRQREREEQEAAAPVHSQGDEARTSTASSITTTGIVLAISGVLLIVLGGIQWSSAASQIRRAFGQTDVLAILLFIAGAIALLIGLIGLLNAFSRGPGSSPAGSDSSHPASTSVEARLRRLDDLRAKQLISDAEYEQRRNDIIASL